LKRLGPDEGEGWGQRHDREAGWLDTSELTIETAEEEAAGEGEEKAPNKDTALHVGGGVPRYMPPDVDIEGAVLHAGSGEEYVPPMTAGGLPASVGVAINWREELELVLEDQAQKAMEREQVLEKELQRQGKRERRRNSRQSIEKQLAKSLPASGKGEMLREQGFTHLEKLGKLSTSGGAMPSSRSRNTSGYGISQGGSLSSSGGALQQAKSKQLQQARLKQPAVFDVLDSLEDIPTVAPAQATAAAFSTSVNANCIKSTKGSPKRPSRKQREPSSPSRAREYSV
jgi:hypothetical protein